MQAQPQPLLPDTLRLPLGQQLRAWARDISFQPYALRLGTDLSYWLNGAVSAPFGRRSIGENLKSFYANTLRFELTADLAFNRNKHFIVADWGYASTKRERNAEDNLRNISYHNTGTYWRVGWDYNVLHKTFTDRQSALLLGFRYGRANFEQQATYIAISTPWGFGGTPASPAFSETISEQLSYRWWEMVTGLRVAVWRELYLGYTFRIKLAGKANEVNRMLPNEIPGFGTVRSNMKLSFSYHLYYRIPLTKRL
ncbi:MAG: DUF6048 family protein [Cytophagales bacterium]|nr:DUF6048 family protein [Bernardetiaceae bacterium]MDW8203749.1 DUF6048 family protein [Cytophagales bacterium]